jgi:ribosomal protein S18 acetylase RimI-like enzyme
MEIRRPAPNEHDSVRALVQTVVDEVYGGIWASPPLPIDEEDWSRAWLAVSASKIVGMVLTHEEWVSDLWVLREHRNRGVGRQLLFHGEAEIAGRGHATSRLRVVKSNVRAVRFYNRLGWSVAREFPHETLPIDMLEMSKVLKLA